MQHYLVYTNQSLSRICLHHPINQRHQACIELDGVHVDDSLMCVIMIMIWSKDTIYSTFCNSFSRNNKSTPAHQYRNEWPCTSTNSITKIKRTTTHDGAPIINPRAAGRRAARFHQLPFTKAPSSQVCIPYRLWHHVSHLQSQHHHLASHRPSLDARALKQLSTSTRTQLQSIQRAAAEVTNAANFHNTHTHPALLNSVRVRATTALQQHLAQIQTLHQEVAVWWVAIIASYQHDCLPYIIIRKYVLHMPCLRSSPSCSSSSNTHCAHTHTQSRQCVIMWHHQVHPVALMKQSNVYTYMKACIKTTKMLLLRRIQREIMYNHVQTPTMLRGIKRETVDMQTTRAS